MTAEREFNFTTMQRAAAEYIESLIDGEQQDVYEIGISQWDLNTGGLERGEVCVLCARPSHCKTLLGLQWLYNVACKPCNCLLISQEMSNEALAKRFASFVSEVREQDRREHAAELFESNSEFWQRRGSLHLVTNCGTAERAASAIDVAVERHNVDFVVVDYLQLIHGEGRDRYHQITNASIALKQAAVRNNIALVALAQLNRGAAGNEDYLPKLSDLKDSGQIEQDADQVIAVKWPLKIQPSHKPPTEFRAYFLKNRNRGINHGMIELRINPSRQTVRELPQTFST